MVALRQISAFIIKDTLQVLRNRTIMALILLYPAFSILIVTRIVNYKNDNLNVAYVDNDNSQLSVMITDALRLMGDETLVVRCNTYTEALSLCDNGLVESILEIPQGYESSMIAVGQLQPLSLSIDAVDPIRAMLGSYKILGNIGSTIARETSMYGISASDSGNNIVVTHFYNPSLDYILYMIPVAYLAIILSLCVNLTGTSIASEKSNNGMDLINASPVSRTILILSKIFSCFAIVALELIVSFLLMKFVYDLVPTGSLFLLILSLSIFVFNMCSTILLISNFSKNTAQILMFSGIYTMTVELMSGYLTPVESFHPSMQLLSYLNPCRHLVEILRNVYLKSASFSDVSSQFMWLAVLALFTSLLAILTYRKQAV